MGAGASLSQLGDGQVAQVRPFRLQVAGDGLALGIEFYQRFDGAANAGRHRFLPTQSTQELHVPFRGRERAARQLFVKHLRAARPSSFLGQVLPLPVEI